MSIIISICVIIICVGIKNLFQNNKGELPQDCYKKVRWKDPVSSQDVTEYTKYYYTKNADDRFKSSADYFQISNENEVNDVKSYFENFIKWMYAYKKENYFKFDLNDIDINDYAYIYTSDTNPNRKFYNYSVEYYDTGKHILYCIRSNI